MAFEAIDTEQQPTAMQHLARFGITRVPAVIVGEQAVHGWNPQGLADLVGVNYTADKALSTDELTARLDLILAAAQRAMCQVPPEHLDMKTPGRDRSVRHLGYHIFRLSLAYKDTCEQGYLPEAWFEEGPTAGVRDGAAIAHYGQGVQETLAAWLQQPGVYDGVVETYYGQQTAPAFFERTVWHAAQHLRQLYVLLDMMGVRPEAPLPQDAFSGLPLPHNVW